MHPNNTNQGQIWPNEQKEKDSHPDFKGSLNVEGEEFWVLVWKQGENTKSKKAGLSVSIQPKESTKQQAKDYVVLTDNRSSTWG